MSSNSGGAVGASPSRSRGSASLARAKINTGKSKKEMVSLKHGFECKTAD